MPGRRPAPAHSRGTGALLARPEGTGTHLPGRPGDQHPPSAQRERAVPTRQGAPRAQTPTQPQRRPRDDPRPDPRAPSPVFPQQPSVSAKAPPRASRPTPPGPGAELREPHSPAASRRASEHTPGGPAQGRNLSARAVRKPEGLTGNACAAPRPRCSPSVPGARALLTLFPQVPGHSFAVRTARQCRSAARTHPPGADDALKDGDGRGPGHTPAGAPLHLRGEPAAGRAETLPRGWDEKLRLEAQQAGLPEHLEAEVHPTSRSPD